MFSKNSFHWRVSSQSQRNVVYRTVKGRKLTVPNPAIMVLNFKWFRGVCMRSEDNFVEFIPIPLGIKLRLSGLYARSFTHWARHAFLCTLNMHVFYKWEKYVLESVSDLVRLHSWLICWKQELESDLYWLQSQDLSMVLIFSSKQ